MTVSHPAKRPRRRRILILTAFTVALLLFAYLGVSAYAAHALTLTERQPITADPRAAGMDVEDVTFRSLGGELLLSGWLLKAPADQGRLVIMVHGHNSSRDNRGVGLFSIAQGLVERGFSVLSFDLRGYGLSEGERFSLAYFEQQDVRGAIRFAQERGYAHIGLLGFSMGAASSLLAAAAEPGIEAVAADSSYASLVELLERELPRQSNLPRFFTPGVLIMARLLYGIDAQSVEPAAAAARLAPRPLLVIHGVGDRLIPFDSAERIWRARYGDGAPDPETLVLVEGAAHVQSFNADRAAYLARVSGFFLAHLR
ncbi:MAG TPA: alpha/beta fold hydrolase [Herpetosiphonaceae bacterium]